MGVIRVVSTRDWIFLFLLIALVPSITAFDYEVVGDRVQVNQTGKGFLDAPYVFYISNWYPYKVMSDGYTGNVNLIIGRNWQELDVKGIRYKNPHNETIWTSYTCQGDEFNYTLSPKYFWCYDDGELIFEHSFENGNLATKTANWSTEVEIPYTYLNKRLSTHYTYLDGFNTWSIIENLSVEADKMYEFELLMDRPFDQPEPMIKYDLAFYPSGYGATKTGVIDAYQDGAMLLLDPFTGYEGCSNESSDYRVFESFEGARDTGNWTADNGGGCTWQNSDISAVHGSYVLKCGPTASQRDHINNLYGDFSMGMWWYEDTGNLFMNWLYGNDYLYVGGTDLYYFVDGVNYASTSTPTDKWYYSRVVVDNTNAKLSFYTWNSTGSLLESDVNISFTNATYYMRVGVGGGSPIGYLDDYRIWDGATYTCPQAASGGSDPPEFNELITAGDTGQGAFGTDTTNRYYRNSTYQSNDFIYISANITDNSSTVDKVLLEFKNSTGWFNHTMTNTSKDIFFINMTSQPEWFGYTFNIWANNTNGEMAKVYNWTYYDYESTWGTQEQWRKTVGLGKSTTENISYTAFYLYGDQFPTSTMFNDRAMRFEQPFDGTQNDTGLMSTTIPTSITFRNCTNFVSYFLNNETTTDDFDVENIYYHIWWYTTSYDGFDAGFPDPNSLWTNWIDESLNYGQSPSNGRAVTDNTSTEFVNISGTPNAPYDAYYLETNITYITEAALQNKSTNDINLLSVTLSNNNARPSIMSGGNYTSFIIYNLPSNATLQGMDSDLDNSSDYYELYVKYTNPFRVDTDDDGISDFFDCAPNDPGNTSVCSDTTDPTFDHVLDNITISQADAFNYDINASDDVEIDTFAVNNSDFSITYTGLLTNSTGLTDKVYYLNITVNDTSNNKASALMWVNVTAADSNPPTFDHTLANFTYYWHDGLSYDINATDAESHFDTFFINESSFDISSTGVLTNKSTVIIQDFFINVSINDTFGNIASSYMEVNVLNDTAAPTLDEALPNSSIVNGTAFSMEANSTDAEGHFDSYIINDTTSFQVGASTGIITNKTALDVNLYYLNLTVNDTYGNSDSFYFWVNVTSAPVNDSNPPTFDHVLANQSIVQGTSYSYDINATDAEGNFDTYQVNNSDFAISGAGILTNNTALSVQIYYLNVTINDTFGNFASGYFFVNVTTNTSSPPSGAVFYNVTRFEDLYYGWLQIRNTTQNTYYVDVPIWADITSSSLNITNPFANETTSRNAFTGADSFVNPLGSAANYSNFTTLSTEAPYRYQLFMGSPVGNESFLDEEVSNIMSMYRNNTIGKWFVYNFSQDNWTYYYSDVGAQYVIQNNTVTNPAYYIGGSVVFEYSGGWYNKENYTDTTSNFISLVETDRCSCATCNLTNLTCTIPIIFNNSDDGSYKLNNFSLVYTEKVLVNITVIDGSTNTSIQNFTGWVYNNDLGINHSFSTNTSYYEAMGSDVGVFGNYSFFVLANGYAVTASDNYADIEINTTTHNETFTLYAGNSIRIYIYDGLTTNLLTSPVTVITVSNVTSFTNVTSSGVLQLNGLAANNYEFRFNTTNYNPVSKFATILDNSSQQMNVYMISNADNSSELQVIEVLDTSNNPVEGAIVWLQKEVIGGSEQWLTVQEAETDFEGKTTVWVIRDTTVFYRFAVIYDGEAREILPNRNLFTGKTSFIPGVTETIQIIIDLTSSSADVISDKLAISTDMYFVDNNTVEYTWIDGRNTITGGRIIIEGRYLTNSSVFETIYINQTNATSGVLNYTFVPINNTFYNIYGYIILGDGNIVLVETLPHSYTVNVVIEQNTGLLYAVFLIMVVALISLPFRKQYGPLIGGVITFGSLFLVLLLGIVEIPYAIVASLIAFIIIVFAKVKGNNEQ